MKDYIEVYDESNQVKKMEVVTIFRLDGYDFNYIIYKEIDNSHYYIAKYVGEEIVDLDTNLSEGELKLANAVFKEVVSNGTRG